jgi:hypothetical protein
MKNKKIILLYFLLMFALPSLIYSQSIEVHNFIGKSRNEVIKKYGNPVHKDDSNPAMICMFFKSKTGSMIFVSDKKGVYQAEATKSFDSQSEARSNIDSFISNSIKNGFAVDTVSTNDFELHKQGVKADLQLSENKIEKDFEIRVKANRTEN